MLPLARYRAADCHARQHQSCIGTIASNLINAIQIATINLNQSWMAETPRYRPDLANFDGAIATLNQPSMEFETPNAIETSCALCDRCTSNCLGGKRIGCFEEETVTGGALNVIRAENSRWRIFESGGDLGIVGSLIVRTYRRRRRWRGYQRRKHLSAIRARYRAQTSWSIAPIVSLKVDIFIDRAATIVVLVSADISAGQNLWIQAGHAAQPVPIPISQTC